METVGGDAQVASDVALVLGIGAVRIVAGGIGAEGAGQ